MVDINPLNVEEAVSGIKQGNPDLFYNIMTGSDMNNHKKDLDERRGFAKAVSDRYEQVRQHETNLPFLFLNINDLKNESIISLYMSNNRAGIGKASNGMGNIYYEAVAKGYRGPLEKLPPKYYR